MYRGFTLWGAHCTMVVCMADTRLGTLLTEWIDRRRLTPTTLADLAGVTRRTVYNVLDTGRASVQTVWKLACALAIDPYTSRPNEIDYAKIFPALLDAAGYPSEIARVIRVDLGDELTSRLRDPEKTQQLLDFLDNYASLPPDEREWFDRALRLKGRNQK